MSTKSIGTNLDVEILADGITSQGWALVSTVTQENEETVTEYKGQLSKLQSFLTYLKSATTNIYWDEMDISVDVESGTATVTLTNSAKEEGEDPSKPSGDETRQPTCVIQGTMLSPQLHQHPTFADLTIKAINATNYCLKTFGEIGDGDLFGENETAFKYARWRSYGIDTYLAPSYTMTLTFFLKAGKKGKISTYTKEAGTVYSFQDAINKLPKKLQPPSITGANAWLAQAPSISIGSDGITVSQAFIGANKFPSFYKGNANLLYDAPSLPNTYWRDSKYLKLTSGEETDETE